MTCKRETLLVWKVKYIYLYFSNGTEITDNSANVLQKKILEVYKEYWKTTNADIDKEKDIVTKLVIECCKMTNLVSFPSSYSHIRTPFIHCI